jgi:hypothetical protein
VPTEQELQNVDNEDEENFPNVHTEHKADPEDAEMYPAGQSKQDVEPICKKQEFCCCQNGPMFK